MDEKITRIKAWLGRGSINIFGLPMSGKDTQGIRLAEALDGKLLSSGLIIRTAEKESHKNLTGKGELVPSNVFCDLVLPYFLRKDLKNYPLILSSIGRWHGEEDSVMNAAYISGHPIKAVIILNISEADVISRYEAAKVLKDRGDREDDRDFAVFRTRLDEFKEKTLPVLQYYNEKGLLINVNGDAPRDEVYAEIVDKLYKKTF